MAILTRAHHNSPRTRCATMRWLLIAVLTAIGLWFSVSAAQTSKQAPRERNQDAELPQLPSDELFDAGTSFLFALQDFYLASLELEQTETEQAETPSVAMTQMMEHLLNEEKYL